MTGGTTTVFRCASISSTYPGLSVILLDFHSVSVSETSQTRRNHIVMADMAAEMVANMVADMVADMVANMVAHIVDDQKVYKIMNKVTQDVKEIVRE